MNDAKAPRHYLDHAATTPMRESARAAWLEATDVSRAVGNPSSLHAAGRRGRALVEDARESVAASLGAHPTEVVFTSGATEANNLAIQGASAGRVVTSAIEHHSALDPVRWLATAGAAEVIELRTLSSGVVDTTEVRELVRDPSKRTLVSVQWVNNETGVIQPIANLVDLGNHVHVHSDAVQAAGHLPVDFAATGLTSLSVSAHKVGGPVGIGALIVRRDARLASLQLGGGQQRFRSGTLDAAGASSFAVALAEAVATVEEEAVRIESLRDHLIGGLAGIEDVAISGADTTVAPHICHLVFPGASAEAMLFALDHVGIEVSSGSACTAGVVDASHVLMAMGRSAREAASTLRVSFGHTTTTADVDALIAALPGAVAQARSSIS